jgi:flagellar hook-length control protein FliK
MPVGGGETPPASPATPATVRAVSPAPLRQTAAAGATIAPAAAALTALPLPPDPKAAAALSAGQTSATASPPAGTLTPAAAGARTAKNPEMASTANTAPAPVVAPLTDTPAAMTPMAGSQPLSDPGLLAAIATPPRIAAAPAAKTDTTHDDTIAPDSAAASAFSPQTPQAVAAIAAGGRATPVQPHLSDKDSAAPHTTGTTAIASTGPSAGTSPATATPASAPATPSTGQSNATPPPTPAAQLASAVASLHVGADGTSHTTIKLDPAELGSVQIRISRATDGTASVSISVERPDTLATLQNDLGHLHQALDRAGLPDQRSVTLHLATQPDQSSATTLGTGTGTAFSQQGGFQQGGRQHAHTAGQSPPTAGTPPDATPAIVPSRATAGAGSGINITA